MIDYAVDGARIGTSQAGRRIHAAGKAYERSLIDRAAQEQAARIDAAKRQQEAAREAARIARLVERVQVALDKGEEPPPLLIEDIMFVTASHFDVKTSEIKSARRYQIISVPRQVVMYLARELTPRSFPEIGRAIGGRDHTTVLHGWRKITARIAAGDPITADVDAIRARLQA